MWAANVNPTINANRPQAAAAAPAYEFVPGRVSPSTGRESPVPMAVAPAPLPAPAALAGRAALVIPPPPAPPPAPGPIAPPAAAAPAQPKTCCEKILDVVKSIFAGIAAALLLVINPTFFIAGLLTGVIWADKAKEAIEKVSAAWQRQQWYGTAAIVAGGILTLPISLAACSTLTAMHLGTQM